MSFFKPTNIARAERIMRGMRRVPWSIDFLDDALTGIDQSDIILLGAATGVGKTQVAAHVAANAARKGFETYYFALEAEQDEIENRLIFSEIAKKYFIDKPLGTFGAVIRYVNWILGDLDDELGPFEEKTTEKIKHELTQLHTIYKHENFDISDMVKAFETVQPVADLTILDHLHYVDINQENELRALKDIIREIRKSALKHKKPIIVVAHLRKTDRGSKTSLPDIDDFYGTSDITKIAVNCVMVARATHKPKKHGISYTWIYIPKARHAGDAAHYAGLCEYDLKTGTYLPGYELHYVPRFGEPVPVESHEKPLWAKRAMFPAKDTEWTPTVDDKWS